MFGKGLAGWGGRVEGGGKRGGGHSLKLQGPGLEGAMPGAEPLPRPLPTWIQALSPLALPRGWPALLGPSAALCIPMCPGGQAGLGCPLF